MRSAIGAWDSPDSNPTRGGAGRCWAPAPATTASSRAASKMMRICPGGGFIPALRRRRLLGRRHSRCCQLSLRRLVDQTVVERLFHVELLRLWMVDELERVGHRFFRRGQRL